MFFNSVEFLGFFVVVFIVYWFVLSKNYQWQNGFLLGASYLFYSFWDWRFLFLLLFSTLLDYYTGLQLQATTHPSRRRFWLWLSIGINIGFLGFFKYYNFFITSVQDALGTFGFQAHYWTLAIILPVGISFYTFHGLSYVIDSYYGRIQAERNFVDYALFVSFFPLLVAGPIERATHLLPQLKQPRTFSYPQAVDGLKQILWGLFKKVVIADQCATYANDIFAHSESYAGSTLLLGAVFFAIQIYGDFSGYSDMASGTARLLGIELLRNFAYPYFSRDMAEFWRRWHISLSSWFKDYLYIPLGGSRVSDWKKIRNTCIIFLVSGFWHGANWTFVVWGLLNALYVLPSVLWHTNRNHLTIVAEGRMWPSGREVLQMGVTFGLTVIAWVFFRAETLSHAFQYLSGLFSRSFFSVPEVFPPILLVVIGLFFWVEWLGREEKYALATLGSSWKRGVRYLLYYTLIIAVLCNQGTEQQFIYFQF